MENSSTTAMQESRPAEQGTPFLQLPLLVDLSGLLADLDHCLAAPWRSHYNQRDYEGGWAAIALRSPDGEPASVVAHPESVYRDTWLLAQCPHFQAVLAAIRCEQESVRLLRQAPGGLIKTHRDQGLHYAEGVFRLHIPLVTNDAVAFVIADQVVPMRPGECWFGDFSLPHSVHNGGATERIHLVIDCIRNAWTDQWFAAAGFVASEPPKRAMSLHERWEMQASLAELNFPAAQEMLAQAKAETDASFLGVVLPFLTEIGIPWRYGSIVEETFLPGLLVDAGCIVIDRARLLHVGDVLHEAGHIALLPASKRPTFFADMRSSVPEHAGDETAVILWTYAAALHLNLPLPMVIHDAGYKGDALYLRQEFENGVFIGLPLLVWMGLCEYPAKAKGEGRLGFPKMLGWMRG